MKGLKAGDQTVFKTLYDNYKEPLYRTAVAICNNSNDAEDVLQDSFVKIFTKIDTLKKPEYLTTWMYRIVINAAKSMTKSKQRKWDEVEEESLITQPKNDSQWFLLTTALQRIPVGYRNVFVLHAIQELPQEKVAAILGISIGTVKSQYHRGRMKLQKILKELGVHYEK
ncbi:MAG: RNA polymerase sigma factor [Candidatus Marinimicrobia bacterium]|nr:RNA polymerase sigma factor [Candidatus Neomarinimicrobiota bacterium]